MQRLEVSGAVRPIFGSLGVKRLMLKIFLLFEYLLLPLFCCVVRDSTQRSLLQYKVPIPYISFILVFESVFCRYCGPGCSVGIATELRAGRSGIESRWGRDFPPVQTGPGPHPASCKMGTGSFPGGKVRPGRAADHSPPSSAAVMEE